MIPRFVSALLASWIAIATVALYSPAAAQAQSTASGGWVVPRTPDGHPDLQGNIVRVEWVNPHSWIHLEITNDEGVKEVWMVEGGTPNVLQRRGLRRECLPIGSELIVDGYQAKDHSLLRANGRDVTFADGTKFFLGSSGTGAPTDGAEARSRSDAGRC